jgi:hypothetical protein
VATGHGLLPSSLPASVGGASLAASVVEEPLASLLAAVLSQVRAECVRRVKGCLVLAVGLGLIHTTVT